MRVALILFLLLLQSSFSQTIKVATWNVRFANGEDSINGNGWSTRVKQIANVVRFLDFDILAIQEPDTNQTAELAELLPEYALVQTDSINYHPIYYKKNVFKAVDYGQFWYSEEEKYGEKGWDARHPRFCSWAEITLNNVNLFVFNTHWDHKGRIAREKSAKLALKKIKQIAGPERMIFMGDLNTKDDSKAFHIIQESDLLENAKDKATVVLDPGGSFTNFNVNVVPNRQIDHVLVSPMLSVSRYGIIDIRYSSGTEWRYPSDHLPIMIELQLE